MIPRLYTASLRAIIPLPDPTAPPGSPAHVSSYQEFPAGSTVMALYPDTSCFYRAEVIATPKDLQPPGRVSFDLARSVSFTNAQC
jgi:SAGA-associated factor 29